MSKIYVMTDDKGRCKIGFSKDPERRRGAFGKRVQLVHQTDVVQQARKIEMLAHRVMMLHGKHVKGEWFEATVEDAIEAIETALRQFEGRELPLGGDFPTGRVHRGGRPPAGKAKGRPYRVAFWITSELRAKLDAEVSKDRSLGDIANDALEQYFAKRRRTEKDRAA